MTYGQRNRHQLFDDFVNLRWPLRPTRDKHSDYEIVDSDYIFLACWADIVNNVITMDVGLTMKLLLSYQLLKAAT